MRTFIQIDIPITITFILDKSLVEFLFLDGLIKTKRINKNLNVSMKLILAV